MLLNDALLLVARGDIKRLLVTMPPRHGKSELISKYFPAWYLGVFPERRVILTSYEADFAATWGRKARDIIEEFGAQAFGITVSQASSAANRWDLAGADGGMSTAGVNGPITGKGAHLAIIDDPVKNSEEALSATKRLKTEEWYQSTLYTRLEPGGAIVGVLTRWHDEDWGGMRIKAMREGGEEWVVLNLPAIATGRDILGREAGDALWPERYDVAALERIRANGERWFEAMYQQRPLTEQGAMFKRHWFKPVDKVPAGTACRGWDMAATEARHGADPDYTAGAHIVRQGDDYFITHIVRDRKTPHGVEQMVRTTAQQDGYACMIRMEEEGGSSGKTVTSYYRREVLADYDFRGIRSTGSKVVRATNFSQAAEAGHVYYVPGAWCSDFFDEIEQFPLGAHDDQVDACALAFNELSRGGSTIVMGAFG